MPAIKFGFWPEVGARLPANASEAEPARADSRYPKPSNRTRIHELQLWIFRRPMQIIGIVGAFLSRAPAAGGKKSPQPSRSLHQDDVICKDKSAKILVNPTNYLGWKSCALFGIPCLFERRACEDLTARRPLTVTRLGASRYFS